MNDDKSIRVRSDVRFRRLALGVVLVYWILWLVITHWPKLELPPLARLRLDKLAHFTGYTLLALLLSFLPSALWLGAARLSRRQALCIWLAVAVGGILDELTQPWFGRSFEWGDYAADLCGGLAGLGLSLLVFAYWSPRQRLTV